MNINIDVDVRFQTRTFQGVILITLNEKNDKKKKTTNNVHM